MCRSLVPTTLITLALTAGALCRAEPIGASSNDFVRNSLKPVFQKHCLKCHGKSDEIEGDVNLLMVRGDADLISNSQLLSDLIEAIDSQLMPPEGEPPLPDDVRDELVKKLKQLLRKAVAAHPGAEWTPIRRMNRFQYNNAVQDLFQLNVVAFPLPERMMREHGNYFQPQTGKMPDTLKVGSRPLGKSQLIEKRLAGVTPFPQDLRAEHGFDNRGDHLSLSPLLLESFLKLSRSIVESPDFNVRTCGVWKSLFAPPPPGDTGIEAVVGERLRDFLTLAFRRPVEPELLDRYARHVLSQINSGESFTDSMKGAAAAAIASPNFFYLYDTGSEFADIRPADDFNLASRLSFFLWGSIPDRELLDLATDGRLKDRDVLVGQVDRMLKDRRLKRFCDSFPAQWLQLEHIISSTPDRELFPQFYFSKYRASMHMMLEPLLLFETVLVEDRSILNFVDSDFSYRSDLLDAWYQDGSQGKAGSPVTVSFHRVPITDRRQGGMITNAAVLTMTSGTTRTKPITRGAWLASVILNDPPPPPPGDVPPLADKPTADEENLTLRERFVAHRKDPACAGCHQRIDPLGFALENFDAAGIWRDKYKNGRDVDSSGTLFGRHEFSGIVEFKDSLLIEKDRFARAFAAHLLSFGLGREVGVEDSLVLDEIVEQTVNADYRFKSLITSVVLSEPFMR